MNILRSSLEITGHVVPPVYKYVSTVHELCEKKENINFIKKALIDLTKKGVADYNNETKENAKQRVDNILRNYQLALLECNSMEDLGYTA